MQAIFSQLKIQTCLLGGWAVYQITEIKKEKRGRSCEETMTATSPLVC
jgi:hypothetical protein